VLDSVGEKRDRSEDRRGREFIRRDWGHDDDEDFQQTRRHGTRRHHSLSGWACSVSWRSGGLHQFERQIQTFHSILSLWFGDWADCALDSKYLDQVGLFC
jgi:hypothetical protein